MVCIFLFSLVFMIGMITYAIVTQTLAILPLILIIVIIGLPAVLIVLTSRKWIYVLWMLSKSSFSRFISPNLFDYHPESTNT